MSDGDQAHAVRLDRVEGEVTAIRNDVGELKAGFSSVKSDVRGLSGILSRIEAGVQRTQERTEEREHQGKPSLVAIVSVLITMISIIVGGAWLISGQLARMDERSIWAQRQIERNEDRAWRDRDRDRGREDARQDTAD